MKAIVVGAKGRMGAHVLTALENAGVECVAKVDGFYDETKDNQYKSLAEVKVEADVLIDFSFHLLIKEICEYVSKTGIATVIATTGHTEDEIAAIRKAADEIPVFYSGNMSLGITLLIELAKKAAIAMPEAEIEIIEKHHNRKLDAPSGTALMIADAITEVKPDSYNKLGRRGSGKRTPEEIGIHSIRMGNIVGEHEVIIGTPSQTFTLKQEAHNRALFAEGALAAAAFILGMPSGLYDMKNIIGKTEKSTSELSAVL